MTRYEAVYQDLWDYFQVLKNDGRISERTFNDYDCKHLTESVLRAIDKAEPFNRLIGIRNDQQGFYEKFENRKLNHDRQ